MHDLEPVIESLRYALERMSVVEDAELVILESGEAGEWWYVAFRVDIPGGDIYLMGNVLPPC
jgi:hypothetical protein